MKQSLCNYEQQYCGDRRHLRETTLNERMTALARFPDFLVSRGVQDLSHIWSAPFCKHEWVRREVKLRSYIRPWLEGLCALGP